MLNLRKIVLYGLLFIAIGFALFLAPIFYQTYQFYYQNIYRAPANTSNNQQTEVYLIGTRHTPTATYDSDTVYQYLEKIQPDLILLELDSAFFNGDRLKRKYTFVMSFYPFLKKYWNLEILAATKYAKYQDHEVRLAAFEWEDLQPYKEIRGKKRSKMMNALLDTQTDSAKRVIYECILLLNYSRDLVTLQDFNSAKNDSIMEQFVKFEYELIPKLVLANDSLNEHHEFAKKFEDYWPTRNSFMAQNILKAIRQNPNKKIVILTGYKHRYLLYELLKPSMNMTDFALLDFQGEPLE